MSFVEPIEERTGNYLLDHWRGNLSLPQSYWINGTLLTFAVTSIIVAVRTQLDKSDLSLQVASALLIAMTVLAAAFWLWGSVGIWRSASAHVSRGGNSIWATAAHAMVVIGALNTAGQIATIAPQIAEYGQIVAGNDPIGTKATLSVSGDTLSLIGTITAGTAEEFSSLLTEHPEVRRLSLQSDGGRIRDARQIAAAVVSNELDTIATGRCFSSCTIVFLSGKRRFAEVGSSLGFHSPSALGMTDDEAQLASPEMRAAYDAAGLPSPFIDKALATPSQSVWTPNEAELVEAGVINNFSVARIVANNQSVELEVNRAGAKKLDEITTLNGAKASGMILIYLYTVSVPAAQIDSSGINRIAAESRHELCANKINRLMINSGTAYSYEYRDPSGKIAAKYTIAKCPVVPASSET